MLADLLLQMQEEMQGIEQTPMQVQVDEIMRIPATSAVEIEQGIQMLEPVIEVVATISVAAIEEAIMLEPATEEAAIEGITIQSIEEEITIQSIEEETLSIGEEIPILM